MDALFSVGLMMSEAVPRGFPWSLSSSFERRSNKSEHSSSLLAVLIAAVAPCSRPCCCSRRRIFSSRSSKEDRLSKIISLLKAESLSVFFELVRLVLGVLAPNSILAAVKQDEEASRLGAVVPRHHLAFCLLRGEEEEVPWPQRAFGWLRGTRRVKFCPRDGADPRCGKDRETRGASVSLHGSCCFFLRRLSFPARGEIVTIFFALLKIVEVNNLLSNSSSIGFMTSIVVETAVVQSNIIFVFALFCDMIIMHDRKSCVKILLNEESCIIIVIIDERASWWLLMMGSEEVKRVLCPGLP